MRIVKSHSESRALHDLPRNVWATGLASLFIGRRKLMIRGWLVYAVIYCGFGLAKKGWQI